MMATHMPSRCRMPAEWEPHAATWLAWPHNESDWPGKLPAIDWVYGEIVRHLAPAETVRLIVQDPSHRNHAQNILNQVGVDPARVEYFQIPTDRGWTRDFGPIFVRQNGDKAIVDFQFNGWAKYDNWSRDNAVAGQLAQVLGHALLSQEMVLEGGAIDVNGHGSLITTEECLLDAKTQVRNPGWSRDKIESTLRDTLGATHVLWLGRGIVGDDTHGHIDDLCRFVNRDTVVLAHEDRPDDANHAALSENRERLSNFRLEDGSNLHVVDLPMPKPLFCDGERLPASYANFYIANATVLVPTFNDPNDRVALGILGELFPNRKVVGIHAVDLVWGLGTLHCLTQQEPADPT